MKLRRRQQLRKRQTRKRKLGVESLEDRRVLSAVALTFDATFAPATIGPGSVSTLTYTIGNTSNPHP